VLTIDIDALFMNPAVRIEALLARAPRNASVVLSADTTLVHTAQAIYKRTHYTQRLLSTLFSYHEDPFGGLHEQGAFAAWLCGCEPAETAAKKLAACAHACDRGWRDEAVARLQKLAQWQGEPWPWAGTPRRRAGEDIAWLPQRSLNSYVPQVETAKCAPKFYKGGEDVTAWRPGDFVLHLAGTSPECRTSVMAALAPKIKVENKSRPLALQK